MKPLFNFHKLITGFSLGVQFCVEETHVLDAGFEVLNCGTETEVTPVTEVYVLLGLCVYTLAIGFSIKHKKRNIV